MFDGYESWALALVMGLAVHQLLRSERLFLDSSRVGDCTGVQGLVATLCYHSTGEYIALAQFMGFYDARGEDYSQRNATMGSTFEARRAGM